MRGSRAPAVCPPHSPRGIVATRPHERPHHRREIRDRPVRPPPGGPAPRPGARPLLRRREPAAPGLRGGRALAARARAHPRHRCRGRARRRPACSRCSPAPTWPPTASATCRPTARASAATARRRSPPRGPRWSASASATWAIRSRSWWPRRPEAGRRRRGARGRRLRAAARGGGDARDATRPGAPAVWDEAPDNVAFVWEAGSRDAVARAFAGAAHVTRLDFVVTRVAAAPIEPRAAVGEYDRRTGRYTLHTGIQGPHGLRALLAEQIFRVPQSHVRVVTGEVGGSFGMRSGIYPELVLVLWAAKRLGRPVKWTSSRREGFVTDEHGRDNVSTAELALDADGQLPRRCASPSRSTSAPTSRRAARAPRTNNVGGLAGVYTTPAIHVETHRRLHEHDADRAVSRRRAPGGDLRDRARHRRGRARARDRPGRAAPPQPDPALGDAVQDRARLHLRLRRLRARHGHGADPRRPRGLRAAPGGGAAARQAPAGSASPTRSRSRAAPTPRSIPTPPSCASTPTAPSRSSRARPRWARATRRPSPRS